MKRILFTHYGEDQIRGSERCLLDLIAHLDRERFAPMVWCNSATMASAVHALGVTAFRSDFPLLFGWNAPRFDLRAYGSLVRQGLRITREHRIELIHANSGSPNQWLNLVARVRGLPLLTHLHSRYPLRDRLTLGLHHSSLAVGVSQPVVDQLLEDGLPGNRVKVIPNGIDTRAHDSAAAVDLRALLGIEADEFVAVTVGSLIQRKGIDLLIEAVAQLEQQGGRVHLAVVGSGPEQAALQTLAQRHDLGSRVHFLGERSDVAGLLRGGADLFVSGAREEVFGLVLAEANLAGLPVVAPRVGGIPEVIDNGVTGLLVEPDNSRAIAAAISDLRQNEDYRLALGRVGRKRVLREFNIENYVSAFEQTYKRLLEDPESKLGFSRNVETGCVTRLLGRGAATGLRNLTTGSRIPALIQPAAPARAGR